MEATEYRVKLDSFEGPLDLLLFLIRRHELEIADIPIATLTEQYLGYLKHLHTIDVDTAGEFLVMAATLMEIKSRMIAAQTDGTAADAQEADQTKKRDETDPRAELVKQLLEYKKFRDAADELEHRREEWLRRTPVRPIGVSGEELREAFEAIEDEVEMDELSLVDLVEAFQKIAASVNLDRLGEHEVVSDDTPIELHAEDIVDRLKREHTAGGQLSLFGIFQGRTRAEMVGLFLAMLDLVRQQRVSFKQGQDAAGTKGEIVVELREAGDDAEGTE